MANQEQLGSAWHEKVVAPNQSGHEALGGTSETYAPFVQQVAQLIAANFANDSVKMIQGINNNTVTINAEGVSVVFAPKYVAVCEGGAFEGGRVSLTIDFNPDLSGNPQVTVTTFKHNANLESKLEPEPKPNEDSYFHTAISTVYDQFGENPTVNEYGSMVRCPSPDLVDARIGFESSQAFGLYSKLRSVKLSDVVESPIPPLTIDSIQAKITGVINALILKRAELASAAQ